MSANARPWLRRLVRHSESVKGKPSRRRRLDVEALEDRRVLATVTLNTDTGAAGELRTVIAASAPGATIDFRLPAGSETINLSAGELVLNKALDINGANTLGSGFPITISGANISRVIKIDDGNGGGLSQVQLRNLTIQSGFATDGAGILNRENLSLDAVRVTGNRAFQPNIALGALGGGILNSGRLSVKGSFIESNTAKFAGVEGNSAFGGGIASIGVGSSLTIQTSMIGGNRVIGGPGGGLFVQQGSLSISQSTISGNSAGLDTSSYPGVQRYDSGGGIAVFSEGPGGSITSFAVDIRDSVISGNLLSNDALTESIFPYGGGFYARGRGTIDISDTCVADNQVGGTATAPYTVVGRGGGLFFYGDDNGDMAVTITRSDISTNRSSRHGGAIGVQARHTTDGDPNDDGTVHITIRGSKISSNTAVRSGGAIYNRALDSDQADTAVVRILNSRISGNAVDPDNLGGGAIVNRSGGTVEIEQSILDGNSAYYGGAVYQYASGLLPTPPTLPAGIPRVTIRNSTITGNTATLSGGGVYSYDGTVEIVQSTISGNTAEEGVGGGVYLNTFDPWVGTTAETFSTISRSTITQNTAPYGGGGVGTDEYHGSTWRDTVISGNTGPLLFEDLYLNSNTSINQAFNFIGGNPLLGPLDNNGGFTPTHLPLAGSPLLNSADPAAVGTADQRGHKQRIVGGRMDIGAVEVGARAVCDRDSDGDCDLNDIDALMLLISQGGATLADRDEWLATAGAANLECGLPYTLADFNLDGVTDGSDFGIWNANKFTGTSQWSKGNVNGDAVVDGSDFGIWNANKFTRACGDDCTEPARTVAPPKNSPRSTRSARLTRGANKWDRDQDAPLGGRKDLANRAFGAETIGETRNVAFSAADRAASKQAARVSKPLAVDAVFRASSSLDTKIERISTSAPTRKSARPSTENLFCVQEVDEYRELGAELDFRVADFAGPRAEQAIF